LAVSPFAAKNAGRVPPHTIQAGGENHDGRLGGEPLARRWLAELPFPHSSVAAKDPQAITTRASRLPPAPPNWWCGRRK
jgi:hypothetical protein